MRSPSTARTIARLIFTATDHDLKIVVFPSWVQVSVVLTGSRMSIQGWDAAQASPLLRGGG